MYEKCCPHELPHHGSGDIYYEFISALRKLGLCLHSAQVVAVLLRIADSTLCTLDDELWLSFQCVSWPEERRETIVQISWNGLLVSDPQIGNLGLNLSLLISRHTRSVSLPLQDQLTVNGDRLGNIVGFWRLRRTWSPMRCSLEGSKAFDFFLSFCALLLGLYLLDGLSYFARHCACV